MLKLREVIEIRVWNDNEGWREQQTIANEIVDNIPYDSVEAMEANYDWSWWRENGWYTETEEGEDLKITVKYYDPSAEEEEESLLEVSTWQSDI